MSQPLSPTRVATVLLAVSLAVLIADLVVIYAIGGHPSLGKLLGGGGCVGVLASVWVSRRPIRS